MGFLSCDKTERITHTIWKYRSTGWGISRNGRQPLGAINAQQADQNLRETVGMEFAHVPSAAEYAYYRVVYAGTTGATSYAATNGNSVLAWRYDDRITDLKVSATTVNAAWVN